MHESRDSSTSAELLTWQHLHCTGLLLRRLALEKLQDVLCVLLACMHRGIGECCSSYQKEHTACEVCLAKLSPTSCCICYRSPQGGFGTDASNVSSSFQSVSAADTAEAIDKAVHQLFEQVLQGHLADPRALLYSQGMILQLSVSFTTVKYSKAGFMVTSTCM